MSRSSRLVRFPTCLILLSVLAGCGGPREETTAEQEPTGAPLPTHFAYESPDPSAPAPPPRPLAGKPNILLVTLDTARRDRFSIYGYDKTTTPHFDQVAREGVLLEDCMTSSPVTLPSHTTILTALEPYQHGVRNNGSYALEERHITLAEILKDDGYATGAVVSGYPVVSQFGLHQGFEVYDDTLRAMIQGTPVPQRIAEQVTPRGLSWIKQQGDRPWFLWIHYFDPHDPYTPPSPWAEHFPESAYDGEMAYMDAHLGGLFRELRRIGQWDLTFLVMTADHGEGLGDHNEPTHTIFIYNTTIAVPLILKFPKAPPWDGPAFWGRRVDGLVATTDILPTILDVAGCGTGELSNSGTSILPLVRDGETVREVAYMESLVPELDYGWSPYFGLRMGPWKLIQGPNPELYRIDTDPHELKNLYAEDGPQASRMEQALLEMTGDSRLAGTVSMDRQTVEALRSLGYAGGGGSRASGELRDAKEMTWVLEAFDIARLAMQQGEMQNVMDILRGVLSRDETNRFAMRMLSYVLVESGYGEEGARLCEEILSSEPEAADRDVLRLRRAKALVVAGKPQLALKEAESLLSQDPPVSEAHTVRARALAAMGKTGAAVDAVRDAEVAMPGSPLPMKTLASMYERLGRLDDAGRVYEQALAAFPRDADLLAGLAGIRVEQRIPREAMDLLQQALTVDPTHARGNFYLGEFQVRAGRPDEAMTSFRRAVNKEPGNARYRKRLGNQCYNARLFQEAVEHLTAAVELGSRDPNAYAGLGFAYARLQRPEEAREMLEKALRMDPQSSLAEQIRRELASIAPQ